MKRQIHSKNLIYSIFFVLSGFLSLIPLVSQENSQKNANGKTIWLGEVLTVVDEVEKIGLVISSQEIKKSTAKDLSDLLREKGLLVMSSGGSGTASNFSFKGYAGFCCKVYIDGVLAVQPGTGEFDWNSIDINSIEFITISEVPEFSTGQFAGCVVNIKTRLVTERGFELKTLATSYQDSNFDTVSLFGEYRDAIGNTGIKVNVQIEKADNNYKIKKNRTLKNNWAKLANISGSFNSVLSEQASLSGTSRIFFNKLKAYGTGSSTKVGIEEDFNSFQTLKARLVTDELSVFCVSLTSQFNAIEYDATAYRHDTTKMHRGDLLFTAENLFGANISSLFALESKITGAKKNRFYNSTKMEWSKEFDDWLKITPSMGFLVSSNGDIEFLPQLTLSSKKTGFALSAFRQFILPTFNQLYWEGSGGTGNEDLKSENGWAMVGSWKSPFVELPLSLTYTVAKYTNKIRGMSSGLTVRPENTENANYRTFETRFAKRLWIFDMSAGVTNTKALLATGKQIMWVPRWQANAGLNARLTKNLEAGISYNYTGKRPEDNKNLYYYEEMNDIDINLRWTVLKNATLLFSVKNLLDERHNYHDSYPRPSRAIIAGLKIQG